MLARDFSVTCFSVFRVPIMSATGSAEIVAGDYDAHSVSLWTRKSWDGVRDLIARAPAIINGDAAGAAGLRGGEVGLRFTVPDGTCLTDLEMVPTEGIGAPCGAATGSVDVVVSDRATGAVAAVRAMGSCGVQRREPN